MGHLTSRAGYPELAERLNRFPQGAPPSESLYRILAVLMTEREAQVLAQMPIKPFTAQQAARILGLPVTETRTILDALASRAVLVDTERHGDTTYVLPPPMAGFFEFSMMRFRGDVDQKLLGELLYQYLNVEDEFVTELFGRGETPMGRTFVHEPVLSRDNMVHVLDYERASEVIESASHVGVGVCYCRHKMMHVGRDCDAPKEICLTFGNTAASLARHGYAREIERAEAHALLQEAYDHGLVQLGENARQGVSFICNCCGCCCEGLMAARKFGSVHAVSTTNFLPEIDSHACSGCGRCVLACPVEAMTLVSANRAEAPKAKLAKLAEDICLGCGVCVRACSHGALSLRSRPQRVITPLNSLHRVVVMAIERGNLQDLIFDNRVLWSHRALAGVLGVVLRLPPMKQAMASQQFKSRYLEYLIANLAPR
jgi:ferredoxin